MAAGCCHPILAWIGSFLLTLLSAFLSLMVTFTTISGRPKAYAETFRPEIRLTVHEELLFSHAALLGLAAVFIQKTLSLISRGEHRDDKFRIEKAFVILVCLSAGVSFICLLLVIVVCVKRDSLVDFPYENSLISKNIEFYTGTTTAEYTLEERHNNASSLVFSLVCVDALSLLLSVVGTILVTGCNRRERYVFYDLVDRRRRSSRSSRSSRHRGRKNYRTMITAGVSSIEAEEV